MSESLNAIKQLKKLAIPGVGDSARFFKTSVGGYSEFDKFMNVSVPNIRILAKQYLHLTLKDLNVLLKSEFNEARLLALIILVTQYQKTKLVSVKQEIYEYYLLNIDSVNNWNLVDASAHYIIGAHLLDKKKQLLIELSRSEVMWHRRISIVATWYFIRYNNLKYTFMLAKLLLNDEHDLIHKATGWMLREAGKKDIGVLLEFLDKYSHKMPRTMLRYAIEKLDQDARQYYLQK